MDGICQSDYQNILKLQGALNKNYPCSIEIHNCKKLLDELKVSQANRVIYSRIFLDKFLPSKIEKCLYLDIDMLVLCDIREIFDIDLKGRTIAAVKDAGLDGSKLESKTNGKPFCFPKNHIYFNSGMMLIDLPKWRSQNVGERAFKFLQNYKTSVFDQDALNAIIGSDVLLLDKIFNAQSLFLMKDNLQKRRGKGFENLEERAKIIHYVCEPKPWQSPYKAFDLDFMPFFGYKREKWWENALNTPVYKDELRAIQDGFPQIPKEYVEQVAKAMQELRDRQDKLIGLIKNPLGFIFQKLKKSRI